MDNSQPKDITWLEWLKCFTPLEVLLSCTLTMATIGVVLALVARILLPQSGCENPCSRNFPEKFEPMLSRRIQPIPDEEVVSRRRKSKRIWSLDEPREIRPHEYPALGAINKKDKVVCMMVIISKNWCLATASCCQEMNGSQPLALMERDSRGVLFGGYDILKIVMHRLFLEGKSAYDIAGVKSAKDFKLRKSAHMKFPTRRDDHDVVTGNMLIQMGWQISKLNATKGQPVIFCWPSILPSNRMLRPTDHVGVSARVLAYGRKVLFIISEGDVWVRLSKLRDWLQNLVID